VDLNTWKERSRVDAQDEAIPTMKSDGYISLRDILSTKTCFLLYDGIEEYIFL